MRILPLYFINDGFQQARWKIKNFGKCSEENQPDQEMPAPQHYPPATHDEHQTTFNMQQNTETCIDPCLIENTATFHIINV